MNWLEFIASIVGSLAWPASAAIIALIFRGQIRILFNRLEELGYGDWKLKLNKELSEAEQVANELPPPPELPQADTDEVAYSLRNDRFDELVAISPNAAILDSWLEIEKRLYAISERLDLPRESPLRIHRMIDAVGKHPLFPSSLVSLLHELRQIRNGAVHSTKVSSEEAYRFKKLSDRVTPFLRPDLFDQN